MRTPDKCENTRQQLRREFSNRKGGGNVVQSWRFRYFGGDNLLRVYWRDEYCFQLILRGLCINNQDLNLSYGEGRYARSYTPGILVKTPKSP